MAYDGSLNEPTSDERRAELRSIIEAKAGAFADSWLYHANTAYWLTRMGQAPKPRPARVDYFKKRGVNGM